MPSGTAGGKDGRAGLAGNRRPWPAVRSRMNRSALLVALAASAATLAHAPAAAQDASTLGAAIARTCGTIVDPATQGVLAGMVTDSLTGIGLPNARVKIAWQAPEDVSASEAEVTTDRTGLFTFCAVPANVTVLLSATLGKTSPPALVPIEAGMLHLESIRLPVSDPTKPGILVGRIVDASTRAPLDGVSVRIQELDAVKVTNERGYFSFGERQWGVYSLALERLGYAPREISVHVTGNLTQNVEIELPQEPIELEGITVSVAPRRLRQDLEGLIRRMNLGFGSFVTRETLEQRPGARLSELMREVPGILVFHNGVRANLEVRGKPCTPEVYLDGQMFPVDPEVGLNEFFTQELEAIEVFKGTEVPPEFVRAGFQYPCAVILVWTRIGR
ncbi:MAG: carboxypeptidase regulatory-like domain-containing protein [Longimicrobiales bacterium]|nr:carboxypeptidase regulatory-like domain-containing protein [Longimicrobiales bacterium]